MRILVVGDIHCDTNSARYLVRTAVEQECEKILSVGDLGYWPHTEKGKCYLDATKKALDNAGLTLAWIDGNHENFDVLLTGLDEDGGHSDAWSPTIQYLPRGSAWEWDGISFMGMGGAISIDRMYRTSGASYWAQEALNPEDIAKAIAKDAKVDVLICHDAPAYVTIPGYTVNFAAKSEDAASRANQLLLKDLVEATQPKQIYHGHWHVRHDNPYVRPGLEIACSGLDRDGTARRSWIVFDTAAPPWN